MNAAVSAPAGLPYGIERDASRARRRAERLAVRQRQHRVSLGSILYMLLGLSGWLATTLLATAGLFVALFFMAGNLSLAGFFEQVALLAHRYGEVAPIDRVVFDRQLLTAASLTLIATGFFRRGALIAIFKSGGVDGPQSHDHA